MAVIVVIAGLGGLACMKLSLSERQVDDLHFSKVEAAMLNPGQDFGMYHDYSAYIDNDAARAAWHYLIGIAACSARFQCHLQLKGEIRDFRFINQASGEQVFSFIVNRRWLLFYFRQPAVRTYGHLRTALMSAYSSFQENHRGEWNFRLARWEDVEQLLSIVDLS